MEPVTHTYRKIDSLNLELDLCLPEGKTGPRPGVLFVHGGGWTGGNRRQFSWHAQAAAGMGFVAATCSYRLAGVAPYPAALDDCQAAVRWMRAHAAEWNLDPTRLGAFGSSAGGHLVACLGVRDTRDDSDPALKGFSSRVQAVVDVHGVHDFAMLQGVPNLANKETFLGGTIEEKPDAWRDASPVTWVDADTAPMLLTHDPKDPTVPYNQTVRMAEVLMKAARPFEFMPTPGSGHGFVYNPQNEWSKRVFPVGMDWLKKHLALT